MCISSFVDLLSTNVTPYILITTALSVFSKCLSHSGLSTMICFHRAFLISHISEEIFCCKANFGNLNVTHPNLVVDVTDASHLSPQFIISPRYEKSVTASISLYNCSS